jgi:MscS family membrane protein
MDLQAFLQYEVWGNQVLKYAVFLMGIAFSCILGWLINAVIRGRIKQLAEKTETKLDDLLVGIIGGPVVLIVVLLGMSLLTKTMDGGFRDLAEQVYSALAYVAAAWIAFRAIDGINRYYLPPYLSKTETKVDDVLMPVLVRGLKVVIAVFVTLLALERFGYGVAPIVNFLLGFAMMLVATAAVSTVWLLRSVVGGLVVLFNKPFEEGDRIAFGNLEGTVEKLEIHRIILRTDDGVAVSVPNHEFVTVPVRLLGKREESPKQPPTQDAAS